jgi:CRP-like cAMP-binding protein
MADEKIEKSYNPGEIVFCEYEKGDEFYIVKEGKIRITKIQDNKEKTLDVFEPPSIFGEMAIIEDAPRSATAIAETAAKLVVIKKQGFFDLMISNPKWALSLIKIFAKRIFDASRRLEILALNENEAKVLDTILMLVEWRGIVPATYQDTKPVELEGVRVEDIAHWCGLDVHECEKHISRYANMGRLKNTDGKLTVTNLPDIFRLVRNKRKIQERDN